MTYRKQINRQQVIETAITIADTLGLEAVTLAEVAKVLGIRVPSLYNHIDGLPGLRSEISLWTLRELTVAIRNAAVGKAKGDAVMGSAIAYRDFVRAHPGIISVALRPAQPDQPELVAATEELLDVVLAIFSAFDLSPTDLLHTTRGFRSILHGFTALEIAGGFGLDLDKDESFRLLIQRFIAGIERIP